MIISDLKLLYPWPAERPALEFDPEGWCHPEVEAAIRTIARPGAAVLMELGSWLGKSARVMLRHAPGATVICVDHWRGSPEHQPGGKAESDKLPILYDQFIRNMWGYRDRVIPVRETTLEGMKIVAHCGLRPEAIYIDASHDRESLYADIQGATSLFPGVPLVGDDWPFTSVKLAVWQAEREGLLVEIPYRQHGQFWWGCTKEEPCAS